MKYPNKPYAFVHIPRTGGTSIRRAMRQWDFLSGNDTQAMGAVYPEIRGHMPAWKHRKENESSWSGIETFSMVRNTWDRIVSCWFYIGKRMRCDLNNVHLFRDWVRCGMPCRTDGTTQLQLFERTEFNVDLTSSQLAWIYPWEHGCWRKGLAHTIYGPIAPVQPPLVKHIIRFEHYERSWLHIQEILGINDPQPISHANKSDRKILGYHDYYNAFTAELIEKIYYDEIIRFGYEF